MHYTCQKRLNLIFYMLPREAHQPMNVATQIDQKPVHHSVTATPIHLFKTNQCLEISCHCIQKPIKPSPQELRLAEKWVLAPEFDELREKLVQAMFILFQLIPEKMGEHWIMTIPVVVTHSSLPIFVTCWRKYQIQFAIHQIKWPHLEFWIMIDNLYIQGTRRHTDKEYHQQCFGIQIETDWAAKLTSETNTK